jgi:hypothetical protein
VIASRSIRSTEARHGSPKKRDSYIDGQASSNRNVYAALITP